MEALILGLFAKYPIAMTVVMLLAVAHPLASAIAALTPTPKDDKIVGKLYVLIDWLALNVKHAKDDGKDSKAD